MKLCICVLLTLSFLIVPGESWAVCTRIYEVGNGLDAVTKRSAGVNEIASALFHEVTKRVGCIYNERTMSFRKGIEEMQSNRLDIFTFAFNTPDWEAVARPEPLYEFKRILLVQKKVYKKNGTIQDYLNDPKIKVAVTSGGIFMKDDELKKLEMVRRVVYDPYRDGTMEMVIAGKAQATFTSPAFYRRYLKRYKLAELTEAVTSTGDVLNLNLYFSKKRVSLDEQRLFAKAIKSMHEDGAIKKILLQYILEEDLRRFYPEFK